MINPSDISAGDTIQTGRTFLKVVKHDKAGNRKIIRCTRNNSRGVAVSCFIFTSLLSNQHYAGSYNLIKRA